MPVHHVAVSDPGAITEPKSSPPGPPPVPLRNQRVVPVAWPWPSRDWHHGGPITGGLARDRSRGAQGAHSGSHPERLRRRQPAKASSASTSRTQARGRSAASTSSRPGRPAQGPATARLCHVGIRAPTGCSGRRHRGCGSPRVHPAIPECRGSDACTCYPAGRFDAAASGRGS